MDTEQFVNETETLRDTVIALAEEYSETAETMDLRSLDESALKSVDRLRKNEFRILVAGETKRGKSSFINALLGDTYLPVDDSIATSQAFEIRHSENEIYRLRFTDGSTKEINREDLTSFGSQKKIDDMGGVIELDGKILDCIEVDIPAQFLPPNIILLDTPGMGAVYPFHAQITFNLVSLCDAVIFVLDSDRPVLEDEIRFLERILQYTPHLFFIQTKIDIHQDTWEEVLENNVNSLEEHIEKKLSAKPNVWPVSNEHLLIAAQNKKAQKDKKSEHYVKISRFDDLKNELNRFLYFISGLSRTWETFDHLSFYGNELFSTVKGRYDTIQSKNQDVIRQKIKELKAKQTTFKEQWSKDGVSAKKSVVKIKNMLEVANTAFRQEFGGAGKTYKKIQDDLDECSKISEVKKYGKNLPTQFTYIFREQMSEINGTIHEKLKQEYKFIVEQLRQYAPYPSKLDKNSFKKFAKILESFSPVMDASKSSFVQKLLKGIVTVLTLNVFQLVRNIRDFLYTLIDPQGALSELIRKIQNEVLSSLEKVRTDMDAVDLKTGKNKNPINTYLDELSETWTVSINKLLQSRGKEIEVELEKLTEQFSLDEARLKEGLNIASANVSKWKKLNDSTKNGIKTIENLETALSEEISA